MKSRGKSKSTYRHLVAIWEVQTDNALHILWIYFEKSGSAFINFASRWAHVKSPFFISKTFRFQIPANYLSLPLNEVVNLAMILNIVHGRFFGLQNFSKQTFHDEYMYGLDSKFRFEALRISLATWSYAMDLLYSWRYRGQCPSVSHTHAMWDIGF